MSASVRQPDSLRKDHSRMRPIIVALEKDPQRRDVFGVEGDGRADRQDREKDKEEEVETKMPGSL